MVGEWFVTLTALAAIAALVAAVPVFLEMVREGRRRHRGLKTGEIERYREDVTYDATPPSIEEVPPGSAVCPHCGSVNDVGYAYCGSCVQEL